MSTVIVSPGADYSLNARAYIVPVPGGLQYLGYYGAAPGDSPEQALARTLRNLAPTTNIATQIGTIGMSTGYVTLDGSNAILTTVPESLSFTRLFVGHPLAINAALFGQRQPLSQTVLNSRPDFLYLLTGFTPHDEGGSISQTAVGTLNADPFVAPRMLSWSIDYDTGESRLRDLTGGGLVVTTIPGARTLVTPATPSRVGGNPQSSGAIRASFYAEYNIALSDSAIDEMHAFVANYFQQKYGITV